MGWYAKLRQTLKPVAGDMVYFPHTVTATEVKAGHVVVPAVAGRKFHPVFAAMGATGSVTTSTAIRLVETTTAGIVLGHLAADLADGAWCGPTGGTPTVTKLNTDLTRGEGVKIVDVAANSLTVTTAISVFVAGYYV